MKEDLIPPASLNQKRRITKICDKKNHHQIHLHTMMKIHSHTTKTSAGCAHTVDLTKMTINFAPTCTMPFTSPTRSKKWDSVEQVKFKRLVREGKIDPERNDKAYIEKIRAKEWGDRKIETFRRNWKTSTAKFLYCKV
jgi:hypothetical protein